MTETDNPTNWVKKILLEGSRIGARLWRRNVGMGWIGQSTRFTARAQINVRPGDVLIRDARPFHNGEKGQSDAYGWVEVTITPDMVGTVVAVHVEIEAKTGEGRESTEQVAWRTYVQKSGGRAGVARDLDDVRRIVAGG